ncbi:ORF20 [Bovine gammaherpesvirus 6]|uniref:ORF20 n=1 Tax=Bovine gammaherpesvirus 6 TaxID=1504288 RepID=A0A060D3M7_9GAMA|nr:ORF20 [Bovine gammaherpesvirus 6]AIB03175.1 ORF20 [Bovine gammaherpesvirus 6]
MYRYQADKGIVFALSGLPIKRKVEGVKAHQKVYTKLLQFTTFTKLSKFLGIIHPCPCKVKFKLFFEVTLGNRIADCVVLAVQGENRVCYVVELKTCMNNTFALSAVQSAQMLQGLAQLSDSTKYLFQNAPVDNQNWTIVAHLVFKSQSSLKTIHVEQPKLIFSSMLTRVDKLAAFLHTREDATFRQLLRSNKAIKEVAKRKRVLGTKSKARAQNKPPQNPRVQKKRALVQKARCRE